MTPTPERMAALQRYDTLSNTHGDDHPLTQSALALVFDLAPPEIQARIGAKARELGLLPAAGGYLADGNAVFRLEDVVRQMGLPTPEIEAIMARFMAEREAAGLSAEPIDLALIHRVQ